MTDFDDDFEELHIEDARGALSRKLRTEGALLAYDTAVAICRDPKATSAAKASAVNSLFRAGGYFVNRDAEDEGKRPSEMSSEELSAALRKTQAALEQRLVDGSKSSGAKKTPDQRTGGRRTTGGGLFD